MYIVPYTALHGGHRTLTGYRVRVLCIWSGVVPNVQQMNHALQTHTCISDIHTSQAFTCTQRNAQITQCTIYTRARSNGYEMMFCTAPVSYIHLCTHTEAIYSTTACAHLCLCMYIYILHIITLEAVGSFSN